MKNIFPGLILMMVFLPQLSFGAQATLPVDPELAAFNQKQDSESDAFFQQQVQDREDFKKANPDIITKEDHRFREWMKQRDEARRQDALAGTKSPLSSSAPPHVEDPTMAAFVAKQLSDKNDFIAKLTAERQKFLSSHPGIS